MAQKECYPSSLSERADNAKWMQTASMSRKFRTANYEERLNLSVKLGEVLPPHHLARFVVDIIAHIDLEPIYRRYGVLGGEAIPPKILLGLLFYGYATSVFSSRKIE